jgi:putative hydrolase
MLELNNQDVADRLREAADLLEQQGANRFRVNAYRRAADTVVGLDRPVAGLLDERGREALMALPGIGQSLASAIAQMVRTGRWPQLERLRGSSSPEEVFRSIPGVGAALARRLHESLDADTLEELEIAAHDGRVEQIPGVGPRRAAMLRAALANMLGRWRPPLRSKEALPSVSLLLDVDREYREQTRAGTLKKIAPRRFNPSGGAWLPILHVERDGWSFTALYSNTQRAHELHRTLDWVVLYFSRDDRAEGQCTVVTKGSGGLRGKRVIRGRELECETYYRETSAAAALASANRPH